MGALRSGLDLWRNPPFQPCAGDSIKHPLDPSAVPYIQTSASSRTPVSFLNTRSCGALWLSVVLLPLLLFSGCSGTAATTAPPPLPDGFPNHTSRQIQSLLARTGDTLQTFSAEGRVTMRSPQENQSGHAQVRQRRADSLLIRFSKFGVEGARLLLTRDSILYYDTRRNVLHTGPSTAARQLLPAPLATGEIFENMLGLTQADTTRDWFVSADSTYYYLRDRSGRTQITVDPTRWRIVRYARKGMDGSVVDERLFTDFRTVEGISLPHRIIYRRPSEKLMAMIRYQDINLNPSTLSFRLNVPSDVPRKPLQ